MLKTCFHCTWIVEKPLTPLPSSSTNILSRGEGNIFIVKKLMKNQERPWSTIINFIDSRGKKVFLLYKRMEKMHSPLSNLLMTNGLVEKTNKPSISRLKFFPLKSKRVISL